MKRLVLIVAFIIVSILTAQTTWPEKKVLSFFEDSEDPLKIKAEESIAKIISDGYEVVFVTKVRVSQGRWNMKCNELILMFNESKAKGKTETRSSTLARSSSLEFGNLRSATAKGGVTVEYLDTMAASDKLTYDHAKRTVTLSGGRPKIWQGSNLMEGEPIIIHLDSNEILIKNPELNIKPNSPKR